MINEVRGQELVDIRLPARASFIATVRTLAAALAVRVGFGPDGVEDLRMAVDEVCSMIVGSPTPTR